MTPQTEETRLIAAKILELVNTRRPVDLAENQTLEEMALYYAADVTTTEGTDQGHPGYVIASSGHEVHDMQNGQLTSVCNLAERFANWLNTQSHGENVAWMYVVNGTNRTPEQVAQQLFDWWLNSPAHRDNIDDPTFNATGVGVWSVDVVISGQNRRYWFATQDFASSPEDNPTPTASPTSTRTPETPTPGTPLPTPTVETPQPTATPIDPSTPIPDQPHKVYIPAIQRSAESARQSAFREADLRARNRTKPKRNRPTVPKPRRTP